MTATDLLGRLRSRGWRLSAQRRAVAESFAGDHVHLTAEQVLDRARERLPEISRATVYNALSELVGMGELTVVDVVDGPRRYDPNVAARHDHLVCERCHVILDVPRSADPPAPTGSPGDGFRVSSVEVTYRGLCSRCAVRS